jgi:hypothetical protein
MTLSQVISLGLFGSGLVLWSLLGARLVVRTEAGARG